MSMEKKLEEEGSALKTTCPALLTNINSDEESEGSRFATVS